MELSIIRTRAFSIFHGVWALCWIGATVYLLAIPQSGDMPASLLTVFTIPAGLLGHGIILFIHFLKHLGDKLVSRRSGQAASVWPWHMLIIAVILLVITGKIAKDLILGSLSYYLNLPGYGFFALLELASLVGLLLRQPWSKWLIIGLFSYWLGQALYVGYRYGIQSSGYSLTIFIRPAYYAVLSSSLIVALLRVRSTQVFYGKVSQKTI
jgi:hypothetical protein